MSQGVIEEADSPLSFPLVLVPKKNSEAIWWAVDYHKLNAITKKDAFPQPNIADNLSRLAGSHVFTALNGAGAFHVVPVRQADREKTAFSSTFHGSRPSFYPPRPASGCSEPSNISSPVLDIPSGPHQQRHLAVTVQQED